MEKKKQDELAAELFSSGVTDERKEEIKNRLNSRGMDRKELEELQALHAELDTVKVPETREKMDREFYRSLDLYSAAQHKERSGVMTVIFNGLTNKKTVRFAAAAALVAFGWLLGTAGNAGKYNQKINTMSRELIQMKEVMLVTMLEQPSATKRMKAISYADDFEQVDDRILNAFLRTLNNDPNPNVRLTAVEALSRYSDIRFVREGLIRSINAQKSPLVQVALVDLMRKLGEKGARPELQKLLQNRELNYSVRNKTRETIEML